MKVTIDAVTPGLSGNEREMGSCHEVRCLQLPELHHGRLLSTAFLFLEQQNSRLYIIYSIQAYQTKEAEYARPRV